MTSLAQITTDKFREALNALEAYRGTPSMIAARLFAAVVGAHGQYVTHNIAAEKRDQAKADFIAKLTHEHGHLLPKTEKETA